LGVKRLFTNFLAVDNIQEEVEKYRAVFQVAQTYKMEIAIDATPSIFEILNIEKNDFSFFAELGVTIIRLDTGSDGLQEALYSFNEQNLKIELNISYDNPHIKTILSYMPKKESLLGCHNFYPQTYTGLELEHFLRCTKNVQALGLRTAAFVASQAVNTHGPHNYDDKVCTLETHRNLHITTQAKHLLAMGIDDVIIANAYATKEEIQALVSLSSDYLEFNLVMEENVSAVEQQILFNNLHFNRGDINAYVHRSTYVKLTVSAEEIPAQNTPKKIQRGDVTIGNGNIGQYKGELNIIKQEQNNIIAGKNKVGTILEEEQFLIDYIEPWTKFKFKKL